MAKKSHHSTIQGGRLEITLDEIETLLDEHKTNEALQLLEPLGKKHPNHSYVQYLQATCYSMSGNNSLAIRHYKRAADLSRDKRMNVPLMMAYIMAGANVHALRILRSIRAIDLKDVIPLNPEDMIHELEVEVEELASQLHLPVKQTEEGLSLFEEADIASDLDEYEHSVQLMQKTIRILGRYAPAFYDLAFSQIMSGQLTAACHTSEELLSWQPDDIFAFANLARAQAYSGDQSAVLATWERVKGIPVDKADFEEFWAKIEVAGLAGDDHAVLEMVKQVNVRDLDEGQVSRRNYFWGIAEANLGITSADRRLREVGKDFTWAERMRQSFKDRLPGPGFATRYPYLHINELLPKKVSQELIRYLQDVTDGLEEDYPEVISRANKEIHRLANKYPQVILLLEKILYETGTTRLVIQVLVRLGSQAAAEVARRFVLGQAGPYEERLWALQELINAGIFPAGQVQRIWRNGEWIETALRRFIITSYRVFPYSGQVNRLIEQGLKADEQNDLTRAESLFTQALKINPKAVIAINNLATVYMKLERLEEAKELLFQCIELDPKYVLARTNLALEYLDDPQDTAKAEELLEPLSEVEEFTASEFVHLTYVRARLAFVHKDFELAENLLNTGLMIAPEDDRLETLLDRVTLLNTLHGIPNEFFERSRKRQQAIRRSLQQAISVSSPTLEETLSVFTKDSLVGMAYKVIPGGGWSALKKDALRQLLVERLSDPEILTYLVNRLNEPARKVLADMIKSGGTMDWEAFSQAYDNDLEESPYWQWHEPETVMGELRVNGLIAEASVDGKLLVVVPLEVRTELASFKF